MHSRAFAAAGVDATYSLFDIPPAELAAFIHEMVYTKKVSGLSISLPHKVSVAQLCHVLTPTASATGAVNTLFWQGDALVGDNTDVAGIAASFEDMEKETGSTLEGKDVAIIGGGGAARAASYALQGSGSAPMIFTRSPSAARAWATAMHIPVLPLDALSSEHPDLLIHATPIGLAGTTLENKLPVPDEYFSHFAPPIVFDMVYRPLITPLLAAAQKAGSHIVTGLTMLASQAAVQQELWLGARPDVSLMKQAAEEALEKNSPQK